MKKLKTTFKKRIIKKVLFFSALLIFFMIFISNIYIKMISKAKLFEDVTKIPFNKVGLLLGTSKYRKDGNQNLFYKYRIDAAVELYNAGKVEYILISGDNSIKYYNEPQTMKNDLIKRGVPANKVFLDFAGFRTLDSVVRCKEVFDQSKITVISQKFHNERAVFIAKFKGVDMIGFNAEKVGGINGFKVNLREKFARVKVVLDILLDKKPRYLGEKVLISYNELFYVAK